MKKKGFTLVELLAVITILAILVILALPNVIELFNEAKINAFVLDVQKIMDSAKGEFVSDKFSSTSGETIYYSSIDDDELNTSKLTSEIPGKEYFIEMDRNGNFKRVVVYDNKFCYDIYTEGTNADLSDSNSKLISEIIKKTNVSRDDVINNETANAEVTIEYDGDKYIVKGCDSSAIGPTEPERTDNLYTVVKNDFTNNSTITKKYSKEHKDSYSKSATHDIYYYTATDATNAELLSEKINVVFANQCWLMIRTTDTGGVKLLYNGEVDSSGKCGKQRNKHIGYSNTSSQNLTSNYYYGTSYEYNSSTNKFKLAGDKTALTWNDATASSIIGKYTCKSTDPNAECDKLYLVVFNYNGSSYAMQIITTANYYSLGSARFNNQFYSLAAVGYKYGKPYMNTNGHPVGNINTTEGYFAKSATYENGKYKLQDYIQTDSNGLSLEQAKTYHYLCLDKTKTECDKIGYLYLYSSPTQYIQPLVLDDGKLIEEALKSMLQDNTNDSSIKIAIEAWYEKNLLSYSNYIEDTIYCADRRFYNYEESGWNPNGGDTTIGLNFMQYNSHHSSYYGNDILKCYQKTDQFSTKNSSAKLKYPIGLLSAPEIELFGRSLFETYGSGYGMWLMTPNKYATDNYAYNVNIYYKHWWDNNTWNGQTQIIPSISLKNNVTVARGNGSMDNPYVIE